MTDETPQPKKIRKSKAVKQGFGMIAGLIADAFDANRPPAWTTAETWKAPEKRAFERALAWLTAEAILPPAPVKEPESAPLFGPEPVPEPLFDPSKYHEATS